MELTLATLEDTASLGRALAQALQGLQGSLSIMLEGDLGAGKTTLTRFLVEALPGGDMAEVSSPSFTLWNIYPTQPEVWHCDLYRLEDGPPPDDFLDALYSIDENPSGEPVLMIVEWPERLPQAEWPKHCIHIRLTAGQNDRRASFTGYGKAAAEALLRLEAFIKPGGQV